MMILPTTCLTAVQRTQRCLARGVHNADPAELLARETWAAVAAYLTARWFPRSVELAIGELIRECYRHALFWFPILQQRCPGTCRPTWYVGTVLTWFRRAVSPGTGQWFYATHSIGTAATADRAIGEALALPGVRNEGWVADSLDFLAQLAATDGRKAVIAQYILDELAFLDVDRDIEAAFHARARPHRRRVMRAGKQGTASYLRQGGTLHLLGDAHTVQRTDGQWSWVDLREHSIPVLDYLIGCQQDPKDQHWRLAASLQASVLAEARHTLKALATGPSPAPARLRAMRQFLSGFEANHRYAPGAFQQFQDLTHYARSQVNRHLRPQLPQGTDKTVPAIRVTNTLIIPRPNPFLDAQPADEWERWFSPYRR